MPVIWQRAIGVFWLMASLSWLAWVAGWMMPNSPPGRWLVWLPLAALLLHPAVFLAEVILAARVHGDDPTPRPSARALVAAALRESWLALRVFAWRQPWRSAAWPDQADAPGVQGVVLVHGYLCNRALWLHWYGWLRERGVPHVSVNLAPAWAGIDHYAPQLEQAVARLVQGTGRTPLLVGHSMGGLVIRAWWRWRQQRLAQGEGVGLVRIDMPCVLTLGTPHQGTWLARWGRPLNVRQMRIGSRWLRALLDSEDPRWRSRFTCVHSHCDNVVFPPAQALLPGARAVHWPGLAHLELAQDRRGCLLAGELLDCVPAETPSNRP
jgi:hypothetical protein